MHVDDHLIPQLKNFFQILKQYISNGLRWDGEHDEPPFNEAPEARLTSLLFPLIF